jgi:hypothetical protein
MTQRERESGCIAFYHVCKERKPREEDELPESWFEGTGGMDKA